MHQPKLYSNVTFQKHHLIQLSLLSFAFLCHQSLCSPLGLFPSVLLSPALVPVKFSYFQISFFPSYSCGPVYYIYLLILLFLLMVTLVTPGIMSSTPSDTDRQYVAGKAGWITDVVWMVTLTLQTIQEAAVKQSNKVNSTNSCGFCTTWHFYPHTSYQNFFSDFPESLQPPTQNVKLYVTKINSSCVPVKMATC